MLRQVRASVGGIPGPGDRHPVLAACTTELLRPFEGRHCPHLHVFQQPAPRRLRHCVERGLECGVFSAALACTEPGPGPVAATSVAVAERARQGGATAMNRLDRRSSPKCRQSGAEDAALQTGPAPRTGSPPKAWTFRASRMWVTTSLPESADSPRGPCIGHE
jgi:hypothetical protein